jgi:hypothetical protein
MSFELIDSELPARDWWLLDMNEYKLTPEWYWHEVSRKITLIILCFVLAFEIGYYRHEVLSYAYLQLFDGIDFVITNNTPWFRVMDLPISFNIIAMFVFSIVIWVRWYERFRTNI